MQELERTPAGWVASQPHSFELCLPQAALLVIDMQRDFCDPEGFAGAVFGADLTPIRAIIPKIQALLVWARKQGLMIIYTRESHRADCSDLSASKRLRYQNAGYPVGSVGKLGRFLIRGEAGTEILEELKPDAQDWVLDKPAQSAFIGTGLKQGLRARGITHLLLTGVTTQCCVLGTYRHARDLGFYALLLEDCCGAFSAADHQAAVDVLLSEQGAVGWVSQSTELLALGD